MKLYSFFFLVLTLASSWATVFVANEGRFRHHAAAPTIWLNRNRVPFAPYPYYLYWCGTKKLPICNKIANEIELNNPKLRMLFLFFFFFGPIAFLCRTTLWKCYFCFGSIQFQWDMWLYRRCLSFSLGRPFSFSPCHHNWTSNCTHMHNTNSIRIEWPNETVAHRQQQQQQNNDISEFYYIPIEYPCILRDRWLMVYLWVWIPFPLNAMPAVRMYECRNECVAATFCADTRALCDSAMHPKVMKGYECAHMQVMIVI